MNHIAIIGTGYVGLVAGVCFAEAGNHVYCVDSMKEKIDTLNSGKLTFYEPGLNDLFQRGRKRMTFTQSIADATKASDVVFVAVGTPEMDDGSADLGPTFRVLEEICKAADKDKIVVLKSTVPIGTWKKAQSFCDENCQQKIEVVNNPEFMKQGAAVEDFLLPDRVVIGCRSENAQEVMRKLYEPFIADERPIIFMDNTSAETTKYAANSFLAMKISFINELSLLADEIDADIESVRAGFTSDRRINPSFFSPGIGYGGSCFPKDVRALIHTAKEHGLDFKLFQATDDVNERQKTILTRKVKAHFGDLKGLKICLWGLSFKPRTDDVRRAPSIKLIEDLVAQGAKVSAYDPVATENAKKACSVAFESYDSPIEAAKGADALLLVTEWTEFKAPDLKELKAALKTPVIFDGRNLYDPDEMAAAGFQIYGIGRRPRK